MCVVNMQCCNVIEGNPHLFEHLPGKGERVVQAKTNQLEEMVVRERVRG